CFFCDQVAIACLVGRPSPVSAVLIIALILTAANAPRKFKGEYWLSLIPLLNSAISLLWGAYWWVHQDSGFAHTRSNGCWQLNTLFAMFWLQFPICIALIYHFKGHRLFVSALLINQLWIS